MKLRPQKQMIGRKTPRPFRWVILIATGFIGLAVYCAHITILPQIVRASGQIAPLGDLHFIGHFDGGVLENVSVRPGDSVQAGEVIATVRQPLVEDDIIRTQQQIEALEEDATRLEALLHFLATGVSPQAAGVQSNATIAQRYQSEQVELYLSRQSTLADRAERSQISFNTAQRVAEKMQERIDLSRQRKARAQDRFDRGLTTIADLERETDRLDQTIAEALQADLRTLDAQNKYYESLAAIENERLAIQQDFTSELYEVETELESLRTVLALLEMRQVRATVTALGNGTIQSMQFTSVGEVVPPGASIAAVLPANDQLVARVRVHPVDIGYIEAGAPARMALTAFDVRRYGYLDGTVLSVSPTSELDEREGPYFEITIALEQTSLAHNGQREDVRAGMEVSTEFQVRNQSLLEYFIGPVQASLSAAFTEKG